jgi:uncharacterized protein (TIRG00374 family)
MKRSWMLAVGVLLGMVMLFVAIRQVDWRAVGTAVTSVAPLWLLLAMLATAAAQALFALRWYVLVGSAQGWEFADAFDFLAIGALAGLVLPNRLSDVARAVAAGRYHSTSATGLFGTIVIERVLDVLMLVGFGTAVSSLMAVPAFMQGALATLFAVVVIAVVVLWLGERGPMGWLARLAGHWRGPGSRVHDWADRFLAGTGVIRERGRIPKALAISLAGWLCAAASASFTLAAFAVSAPWVAGAFAIVIINLAGILPAPPAGIGVYHYSAMVGVTPWMPDASRAFAFALVSHAMSVAVVMMLGTWSLARKGLSLRGLRRMAEQESAEGKS